MIEKNDWRLSHQENYLMDIPLVKLPYVPKKSSDHDHCEFSMAKFGKSPEDLHEGFTDAQRNYWWICSDCYEDFKEMFRWKLLPAQK